MMVRRRLRTNLAVALTALACVAACDVSAQATLDQRLQRVERALDNQGLIDLVRQVELLNEQIRQLRGELENQVFALEQVRKSQRNAYLDIDRRVGVLEQGGIISVPAAGNAVAVNPNPAAGVVDPPLSTLAPTTGSSIAGDPADQAIAVDVPAPVVTIGATGGEVTADVQVDSGAAGSTIALAPTEAPQPGTAVTPGVDATLPTAPGTDQLMSPAATSTAPATPSVTSPAPSIMPAAPTVDNAESEAAYQEAISMLKAGQYEESIAAFNLFLSEYGNSRFADNAQYWIAEAYYKMRQFEPAIEQYQKFLANYPDSKKQSHALLKVAYSYHELGMIEEAAGVLGELKNRFPGTAAARLAEVRLQQFRSDSL